jgi:hypothetical protein
VLENNNKQDLCFVTSIFGDSVAEVDHPANVEWFADHWCNTQFWLVTNLEDLPAPGWTKLDVSTNPDIFSLNNIVQSRYAKFLAWQVIPTINQCQTVIYMDGYLQPHYRALSKFRKVSKELQTSEWGLAQVLQPYFNGLTMEAILKQLTEAGKDTTENANATLEWMREQEDYQDVMPYYLNKYLGKKRVLTIQPTY